MKAAEKSRRLAAVKKRMSTRREQIATLRRRLDALNTDQAADAEQETWLQAAPVHDDSAPAAEATP